MALIVDCADPTTIGGLKRGYLRIARIVADYEARVGNVRLHVYRDALHRAAGMVAAQSVECPIGPAAVPAVPAAPERIDANGNVTSPAVAAQGGVPAFDELFGPSVRDPRAAIYDWIKTRPEFTGAVDA